MYIYISVNTYIVVTLSIIRFIYLAYIRKCIYIYTYISAVCICSACFASKLSSTIPAQPVARLRRSRAFFSRHTCPALCVGPQRSECQTPELCVSGPPRARCVRPRGHRRHPPRISGPQTPTPKLAFGPHQILIHSPQPAGSKMRVQWFRSQPAAKPQPAAPNHVDPSGPRAASTDLHGAPELGPRTGWADLMPRSHAVRGPQLRSVRATHPVCEPAARI